MHVSVCFLLCFFFVACSNNEQKERENLSCQGTIIKENQGLLIALDLKVLHECYVSSVMYPYYTKKKADTVFFKMAPPTKKISSNLSYSVIASKNEFQLKQYEKIKKDTIVLPWLGLHSDSIILFEGKKIAPILDHYFPEGSEFTSFINLHKGTSLIIDIPCVDKISAKKRNPFHIDRPIFPFLRCKVAPAKNDYYGE